MAKETAAKKETAAAKPVEPASSSAPPPGGKSPLKVILLVVGVIVLEAATVGLTMMMSGGPKTADGHAVKPEAKPEEDRLAEIMVVRDQFPNQRTGRTYLYDTEIWIVVKGKEVERIKKQVESMQATLATDLAVIFRRAEPAHLLEPTLATLTRQVKASLDERLGRDAEGNAIVHEALIRKCIQFRADG